jgi:ubiquinone/menaquinone biosynthesis C-methylase UbiE
MSQRISNLYRLVTLPSVYKGLMTALGAERAKARLAQELYRAAPGAKVLDVGCGPASIFPYLPKVDYIGMDLNPKHIEYAIARYGNEGRFLVGDASRQLQGEEETFDLVIVSALLHHLDDDRARDMLAGLCRLTKPGGRIVTFDNVWLDKQNPVAWSLNKLDSGLNVRFEAGYRDLVAGLPLTIEGRLYRDLLRIPYDHFSMTLTKA